jgi:UDP-glucuronate 4-epimerase
LSKWKVIGLDAMTDYYDVNLKKSRLKILLENTNFYSYTGLIQDPKLLDEICSRHNPKIIIHLAAQAGVRYSIENPVSYVESNLIGTFHILEMAKKYKPDHLLMASTSSVYGSNKEIPMQENQKCDTPMSFYAATKKSNELVAHAYSHLFGIKTTGLRFFTVYGPWGRPDMALFLFAEALRKGEVSNLVVTQKKIMHLVAILVYLDGILVYLDIKGHDLCEKQIQHTSSSGSRNMKCLMLKLIFFNHVPGVLISKNTL